MTQITSELKSVKKITVVIDPIVTGENLETTRRAADVMNDGDMFCVIVEEEREFPGSIRFKNTVNDMDKIYNLFADDLDLAIGRVKYDAALALLVEPTPDYTYILECLRNRDLVVGHWDMSEEDAIEQAFSHEQDPAEYNRLAQTVTDGHEFFNDYKFHSEHRTPVYIRNDAPANALAHEYQSAGHLAQGECHRLIYITAR